jgi:aminoglycoside phosphotransferase (APT) family kinase protein
VSHEPEVDLSRARRFIDERFPDLRGLGVEHLGSGWDFDVYVTAGFVFRFPRNALAAESIAAEVALLPQLARHLPTRLPVPERVATLDPPPRGVGSATPDPPRALPWQCAGHAFIPGVPVYDAFLGAEQQGDLAVRLANFLRALHGIPPASLSPGVGPDPLGRLDEPRRGRATRELLFAWRRDGVRPRDVAAGLFRVLDSWPGPPNHAPGVVVHADLHGRNLLVTPDGRLSGVIDWVDVHLGYAETDLSTAFEVLPAAQRTSFFLTYGAVAPAVYTRARWRAIDHLVRTFASSIERRDESFARACREALVETSRD